MRPLASLLTALALSGCGGGDSTPPVERGSPVERHGERALSHYDDVEAVRAELVPASDTYVAGLSEHALVHAAAAEDRYLTLLSRRVRPEDGTLDTEITVAFPKAIAEMRDGRGLRGVRTRLGYISGQLLDGALAALVPRAAREDPGLKAEVLRGLLDSLEARYAAAGEAGVGSENGRLAAERAYGLLGRAQAVARSIGKSFGPQLDDVSDGLAEARELAYPLGVAAPVLGKDDELRATLGRVRAALVERFGLGERASAQGGRPRKGRPGQS